MNKSNEDKWKEMLEEARPEIERLRRWDAFYKLNPHLCPHTSVIAAVAEDGKEQPGICMTCEMDGITSDKQGDYPDGEPVTVTYGSTAHTITTQGTFMLTR